MGSQNHQLKRRIFDASGDNTPTRVAEDGALQIKLASPNQTEALTAIVTARDLTTGAIIELETHTIGVDRQSFYVNLKDKLIAHKSKSISKDYSIYVSIKSTGKNQNNIVEQFSETITLIKTSLAEGDNVGSNGKDNRE